MESLDLDIYRLIFLGNVLHEVYNQQAVLELAVLHLDVLREREPLGENLAADAAVYIVQIVSRLLA